MRRLVCGFSVYITMLAAASLSLGHALAQDKPAPAKQPPQKRLEPWEKRLAELEKLRGTWGVVASEEDGEVTRYDQPASFWRFSEHEVREWLPGARQSKLYPLYRCDLQWLDLFDFSPGHEALFVRSGLCRLKDDTLVWTYPQDLKAKRANARHAKIYDENKFSFTARPLKLATARGDGLVSLTLQRVTDKTAALPPEERPDFKPLSAPDKPAEPTDWERLQGTWAVIGYEEDGVAHWYGGTASYWQFRGHECREWLLNAEESQMTPLVRLDAGAKVKRLDEIKLSEFNIETYYWGGAYQLDGDELSLTKPQGFGGTPAKPTSDRENQVIWNPRPKQIETTRGDGYARYFLKRVTDKEEALTPEEKKVAKAARDDSAK